MMFGHTHFPLCLSNHVKVEDTVLPHLKDVETEAQRVKILGGVGT